jgi:hypothetical protein
MRRACQSSTSRPNESSPGSSTGLPSCSTQACARNSGVVRAPMTSFAWIPRLASRRVSTSERIRQRVSPGTCESKRPTARPRRRASSSESAAGGAADGDRERSRATTVSIGVRRSARRDWAYAARISMARPIRAAWLRRSTFAPRTVAMLVAAPPPGSELGTAICLGQSRLKHEVELRLSLTHHVISVSWASPFLASSRTYGMCGVQIGGCRGRWSP